jgi:hypothetical protein
VDDGFEKAKGGASVTRATVGGAPRVHPGCGALDAHNGVKGDWAKPLIVPGFQFGIDAAFRRGWLAFL